MPDQTMGPPAEPAATDCLSATHAASGVSAQPRPASINRRRLASASGNSLDDSFMRGSPRDWYKPAARLRFVAQVRWICIDPADVVAVVELYGAIFPGTNELHRCLHEATL